MIELYWGCLAGGVLFAVVSGLLGDVVSHLFGGMLDFLSVDFLKPLTIATFVTGFGGVGILLDEYSPLPAALVTLASAVIAFLLAVAVYFGYIKPMQRAENSTGFSMGELTGRIAEVTVPIPPRGYGEVLVRVGASHTNQIAASTDQTSIAAGRKVVVVDSKQGTLYVSPFLDDEKEID